MALIEINNSCIITVDIFDKYYINWNLGNGSIVFLRNQCYRISVFTEINLFNRLRTHLRRVIHDYL